MALPAVKSFIRKTFFRSSTKKKRSPSSPSSSSTAPHRSSSKKPTAASEDEGIGAGEKFVKKPERNEEKGDTSSGKNEGIIPPSPPMLLPTSEASSRGESKSKELDSTGAKEDQAEHKREISGQREIERTSEEQAERIDVKDDASSTSLKPLPDDKKIQAGETAAVSSSSTPSIADEERTTKGDDMTPERREEDADTNGGKAAGITPSLKLAKMSSEKSSIDESKNKEYGSFGDRGGEGIRGTSQGQGDQGGERNNVEEATMSSTSLKPMPAAYEEIPTGDQKLSSMEAISSSSIPAAEDEEKPTKSGDMMPKRKEGYSPSQLSAPMNEMSSMGEDQEEHKMLKNIPSPSATPEPSLTREAHGQGARSNGSGGIVPSPSPMPLSSSKQSSTGDSNIEESETKLKGESTSEETKLSQTFAEDKRMLEGEETMKGGSITEIMPSPSGRSSTEEPKTTAGREGPEEHSRHQEKLETMPKQPSVSSALPASTKPWNKESAGEKIITGKDAMKEELQQGMNDAKEQIKRKAIIKKTRGLKEEMKGIISKPSYEESRTNDGAIPSSPEPALPGETGSRDQLRDLKDDEIEAEKHGGREVASGSRTPGTKLGVIAMVTAIVCLGSVVLVKRLEDVRRRKSK